MVFYYIQSHFPIGNNFPCILKNKEVKFIKLIFFQRLTDFISCLLNGIEIQQFAFDRTNWTSTVYYILPEEEVAYGILARTAMLAGASRL
jgi:hypothetical protein